MRSCCIRSEMFDFSSCSAAFRRKTTGKRRNRFRLESSGRHRGAPNYFRLCTLPITPRPTPRGLRVGKLFFEPTPFQKYRQLVKLDHFPLSFRVKIEKKKKRRKPTPSLCFVCSGGHHMSTSCCFFLSRC